MLFLAPFREFPRQRPGAHSPSYCFLRLFRIRRGVEGAIRKGMAVRAIPRETPGKGPRTTRQSCTPRVLHRGCSSVPGLATNDSRFQLWWSNRTWSRNGISGGSDLSCCSWPPSGRFPGKSPEPIPLRIAPSAPFEFEGGGGGHQKGNGRPGHSQGNSRKGAKNNKTNLLPLSFPSRLLIPSRRGDQRL